MKALADCINRPRFGRRRFCERGVGLGLVIVRRIAEHHGGRAHLVESGPAGATFEVAPPRVSLAGRWRRRGA